MIFQGQKEMMAAFLPLTTKRIALADWILIFNVRQTVLFLMQQPKPGGQ
jgi:hypothetical protein